MSLLQNTMAKSGTANFYNGVATTSLRFVRGSDNKLSKTPDASNQKKHTLSLWIKRAAVGTNQTIIRGGSTNSDVGSLYYYIDASTNRLFVAGHSTYFRQTTQVFRDTSAWCHLVFAFDSTLADANSRMLIYVNGVVVTSFAANNAFTQNTDYGINRNELHTLGSSGLGAFDGYMAEINFIDGTQLTPSSFGETKNGVWIPKDTSGLTFGTEGYRLQMKQVGLGTASTTTIGADTSGNTNHYTSSGIVASDCAMPDSPENNFATWNAVYRIFGDTGFTAPTNGALFTRGSGDVNSDRGWGMSTIAINEVLRNSDGAGVYMEVRSPSVGGDNGYIGLFGRQGGDMKADGAVSRSDNTGYSHHHLISPNGRTLLEAGESSSAALAGLNGAPTDNAVIGFAVKSDGKFFISVDGTFSTNADGNTQNPVTGANPMGTIDTDIDFFLHAGNISVFQANFGQDSTFGGNETATTNADANGIGAFHTAPPTGYLALCSANMAEPTIGPNSDTQADDYFNTVLYTGNGGTGHAISGVGFQPDWTWIKGRSNADYNYLVDSSRGYTERLFTNLVDAASTEANTVTQADSDGFTVGSDAGVNRNNSTYVAWNWKANGGTTTSFSESGNNPAGTHQANATAGFSIVTYTGTGADGTISHGLGAKPAWYFVKNRDVNSHNWLVWHQELATNGAMSLNLTAAAISASARFTSNEPTTSVFYVGSDGSTNADGQDFIAYVFSEVEGYSRFGSYIGNGSTNGLFVYLGFRPAWIMIKKTSGTDNWEILDNKRPEYNQANLGLFPNTSGAEASNRGGDLVSNGFKARTGNGSTNESGYSYIYMAFAEAPFKYANAR